MADQTRVVRSAWVRHTAAAVLFFSVTLANTWPLATHVDERIGQHGDAFFSVWRLAWVAHQLRTDPLHLFDANIFYPERRTLAYSDAMLLPGTVLAPFHWLGGRPLVIYNVFLLSTFVLNALAAYVLVYRLVGSYAAGLLGGVVFAFAPYRFDHFDHLEMQLSFWTPLAVLAWHRAVEHRRVRDCLAVALFTCAQILSCIYYAVFLMTWFGVVTAFWFWRTPAHGIRVLAYMLVPAVAVFALYSLPYLGNRDRLGERPSGQVASWSAQLDDFASSPPSNRAYGWTSRFAAPERYLFPGLAALALLVAGLWPPLDRRRAIHVAGLVFAFLLALGSNGPVYDLLYDWVLPYRGLRVPARAHLLILLGTAVLAGYGLNRLVTRLRRGVAIIVVALILAIASVEYLSEPDLQEVDERISEFYPLLRDMPDAVLFEWPVTVPWRIWNMVDVTYMYRSTLHWRPLLNGYSGFYPDSYMKLLVRMRSFPNSGSIRYLQRLGATVLVIHELPGRPKLYEKAIERLGRDPKIEPIATGRDSGLRITFFRLAPGSDETTRNQVPRVPAS
jgi:hypothetical protein